MKRKSSYIKRAYAHSRGGQRSQRGMALLFTLGILSIILVIVMIFVSYSRSEQKTAAAYSNSAGAKFIAVTGLQHAMAALTGSGDVNYLVSKTLNTSNTFENAGDYDWIWKLETPGMVDFGNTYDPGAASSDPTWQYIRSDGKIIGRFAYRAAADLKMNANAFAAHGDVYHIYCANPAADSAFRTNATATACNSICERHLGVSTAELVFPNDLLKDGTANVNFVTKASIDDIKATPSNASKEPNWLNAADMLENYTDYKNADADTKALYQYVLDQFFNFENVEKYEAFWGGFDATDDSAANPAKSTTEKLPGQYYHRFNLRRDNWNTITVDDILAAPKRITDSLSADDIKNDKTGGIPWFRNWSSTANKNQVIANFINYNSDESRDVVTDVAALWSSGLQDGTHPAYTGLKRTPYLNEVDAELTASVSSTESNAPAAADGSVRINLTLNFSGSVKLYTELVNMYRNPINGFYRPFVEGSVSLEYEYYDPIDGATKTQALELSADGQNLKSAAYQMASWNITDSILQSNYTGYTNGELGKYTMSYDAPLATVTLSSITPANKDTILSSLKFKPKLVIKRAYVMKMNGNTPNQNVDYAALELDETNFGTGSALFNISSGSDKYLRVSFQAEDPRQNLNMDDWNKFYEVTDNATSSILTIGSTSAAALNYTNAQNATRVTAKNHTDSDTELADNPAWLNAQKNGHVSTAFIRHAPMLSFWEAGAIHRAEKWRTINLSASPAIANSEAEAFLKKGGASYTDGDGALLDQLKLIRDIPYNSRLMSKVNIAKYSNAELRTFNFKTLFKEFKFKGPNNYCNYDILNTYPEEDPSGAISDNRIDAMVDALAAASNVTDSGKVERRTDTYRHSAFRTAFSGNPSGSDALPMENDAMKEQFAGRIMNLMDVESKPDTIKVVVLAQSIRDVGGTTVYVDWNRNGTLNAANTNIGNYSAGYLRNDNSKFK